MSQALRAAALTAILLLTQTGCSPAAAQDAAPSLQTTGTPACSNYTGPLRPRVHFSTRQNFMNDPTGLFRDATGTWHLYYQYNPTALVPGNQHWGHATSKDLYRWQIQPVALSPPEERAFVYDGSVVVDAENTSGFFPGGRTDGVVAVFTIARFHPDGSPAPQTQNIAFSLDGGFTFTHYDGNPVLDRGSSSFRDPSVVRFGDSHWVMVVAYARELTVGFFTSTDLRSWTAASNFSRRGVLGAQFEAPNLVRMPVRDRAGDGDGAVVGEAWVLTVDVHPGAPLGGSATQYFVGDFDGLTFSPFDGTTHLRGFAKDDSRPRFATGLAAGTNAVSLSWASNWQYAARVPTGGLEGWRGGLTLPRESYLIDTPRTGFALVDEVYAGLRPVLFGGREGADMAHSDMVSMDVCGPATAGSGAYVIDVNITGLDARTLSGDARIDFSMSAEGNASEALRWGAFFGGEQAAYIDRSRARGLFGEDDVFFTDKFSTGEVWDPDISRDRTWRMRAVVDRSVLEVYVDGGAAQTQTGTMLFFPRRALTVLEVKTTGLSAGARVVLAVNELVGSVM